MDPELEAALAASAKQHQQECGQFVLQESFHTNRTELRARDDPDLPENPKPGEIVQLNTLNQFSEPVAPSIREFDAPSATCGYFAPANALLLADAVRAMGPIRTQEQLVALRTMLQEPDVVMMEVRAAMQFVQQSRSAYVCAHKDQFRSASSERKYMRNWVANYELSDYLIQQGGRAAGITFVRYNQWPERGDAEHEEAERMQLEESIFGGTAQGDKAKVQLEAGAARFIVEEFVPARRLTRVPDWEASGENPVFVIDLNGHFVAALALTIDGCHTLALFNTTSANYINDAAGATFDLAF